MLAVTITTIYYILIFLLYDLQSLYYQTTSVDGDLSGLDQIKELSPAADQVIDEI